MSESTPGHARLRAGVYLVLAWRNLLRNPRRTSLTMASLVVGIGALTLLSALNDGWLSQTRDNFILGLSGHVQVHARGFEETRGLSLRIPDPERIQESLADLDSVAASTRRVRTSGLAAVAGAQLGVEIMALDTATEAAVTQLRDKLSAGQWLDPGRPRGLLLGAELARDLELELGDKLVLTSQTVGGELSSESFHVRGLLSLGVPALERSMVVVELGMAQRWLGLGEAVTDIVIRARRHGQAGLIQDRLAAQWTGAGLEVQRWDELDPMVSQWLAFSEAYSLVVLLIVVALVVAEVLNTMFMALHERMRELGIMEALGTRKSQIFLMVLAESVLLVLLGTLAGYGLGVALVVYFSGDGIDLSAYSQAFQFFFMSPVIFPSLEPGTALRIIGSTLLAALLSGLYPAWRATRIQPVRALKRI